MHIAIHQIAQMMDVRNVDLVDLTVSISGDKVWVNCNDSCLLRIQNVKKVIIHDERGGRA